LKDYIRKRICI